jgi:tRNA A37 threonylcarbamoyladenosine synthetase subunit TsaC/SUA5/YrdC
MPAHPVAVALCKEFGALAVASAVIEGEADLETAEAVADAFGDAVPVVIDGGRCAGVPSTVVDATGEDPHLIREGRLLWSEIAAVIAS